MDFDTIRKAQRHPNKQLQNVNQLQSLSNSFIAMASPHRMNMTGMTMMTGGFTTNRQSNFENSAMQTSRMQT